MADDDDDGETKPLQGTLPNEALISVMLLVKEDHMKELNARDDMIAVLQERHRRPKLGIREVKRQLARAEVDAHNISRGIEEHERRSGPLPPRRMLQSPLCGGIYGPPRVIPAALPAGMMCAIVLVTTLLVISAALYVVSVVAAERTQRSTFRALEQQVKGVSEMGAVLQTLSETVVAAIASEEHLLQSSDA